MLKDVTLRDTNVIFTLKKKKKKRIDLCFEQAGLRNAIIIVGCKLQTFSEKKSCPKRVNRKGGVK